MPAKTTLDAYPLERSKIMKKTIGTYLWLLPMTALVLVLCYVFLFKISAIFCITMTVIFVALIIIVPIYQSAYYRKYFYDVRSDFLVIKKGVIMVRETILNYDKLQDVYMDQDLLDRMFGLWDAHVSTATNMSGMEAHIDGVNHNNAEAIRDLILSKIKKTK